MKILKVKQPDGTIVNVPLGKGADGKSAYQYAREGGYTGTEAEFIQLLGNLDNGGSYTETDPTVPAWAKASTKPTYTAAEVGALPSTTKIPSKVSELTNDSGFITSAPVASVNNKTGAVSLSASDVGAVPTARTVNGKALSSNITLSASDVGALPSTTTIPTKLSDLATDATHRVVTDTEKSTWNAKANTSAIPTKVSQLKNDAGYVTDVPNEVYVGEGDMPEGVVVQFIVGSEDDILETISNLDISSDGYWIINGVKTSYKAIPMKGVDFFTPADKTEIVNSVIAALPRYAGEME